MKPPHPSCSRLQNFVATMRAHGNDILRLNIPVLLKHNAWLTEGALKDEWAIQDNGGKRLPEELAVSIPPVVAYEGDAK